MRILMYHAILPDTETNRAISVGHVHVSSFERHLRWLRRNSSVMSLGEAVDLLRVGEKPPTRCTVLTFDDGLWNQAHFAFPLLERYELPATFFVATSHLDSSELLWFNRLVAEAVVKARDDRSSLALLRSLRDWIDADPSADPVTRVAERFGLEAPDGPLTERLRTALGGMTIEQLMTMSRSRLVEFGAHTVKHPRMTLCTDDHLEREIRDGRRTIETSTGRRVRLFAYPEGRLDDRVVKLVERVGFDGAAAVEPAVGTLDDVFRLPRLVVNRDSTARMVAKWAGLVGPVRRVRRALGLRVPSPQ